MRGLTGAAVLVGLAALIDEALFAFISKTIQGLKPHLFDAQNIALVTNAFAKAEIFDESLFNYMARVALNVEVRPADAHEPRGRAGAQERRRALRFGALAHGRIRASRNERTDPPGAKSTVS